MDKLLLLLQHLPAGIDFRSTENDIMPALSECAQRNSMRQIQPALRYLIEERRLEFTAKAYSTMLKGYGRQGNEAMVSRVLQLCHENSIAVDAVFVNSAIDAYIR